MLAFLCGGVEDSGDGAQPWRERLRLWMQENLNHRVYEPGEGARRVLTDEESRSLRETRANDSERYRKLLRAVIKHDLDVMERQADYAVCFWDQGTARDGGALAELTAACRKGIPVYLVSEMAPGEIGGWVLGCTDKVFSSFDKLKSYLDSTYGKEARQRELWEAR